PGPSLRPAQGRLQGERRGSTLRRAAAAGPGAASQPDAPVGGRGPRSGAGGGLRRRRRAVGRRRPLARRARLPRALLAGPEAGQDRQGVFGALLDVGARIAGLGLPVPLLDDGDVRERNTALEAVLPR